MVREVFEVSYQRRDNLASSPIVTMTPEYAGELVRVLLQAGAQSITSVTVMRRLPMPGEVPNA